MIESYEYKGKTIEIHYDDDAGECPLEWLDENVQFVTFEKNSLLSNYHSFKSPQNMDFGQAGTVFNLYKYEHGAVVYGIHEFACPWDSGQVGVVFVSDDICVEPREYAEEVCKEVTSWCNGEVCGYSILNEDESCWGFLGDIELCKTEANLAVDALIEREAKDAAALEAQHRAYGFSYLKHA